MVKLLAWVGLLVHDYSKHHWLDDFVDTVLQPELVLERLVVLLLSGIEFFFTIHIYTYYIITNDYFLIYLNSAMTNK